jgi:hypothetical protein
LRSAARGAARPSPLCLGPLYLGHGYLRAFLEALAAAGFPVFFAAVLLATFAAGLAALGDFVSLANFSTAGWVSPK